MNLLVNCTTKIPATATYLIQVMLYSASTGVP